MSVITKKAGIGPQLELCDKLEDARDALLDSEILVKSAGIDREVLRRRLRVPCGMIFCGCLDHPFHCACCGPAGSFCCRARETFNRSARSTVRSTLYEKTTAPTLAHSHFQSRPGGWKTGKK